MAFKIYNMKLCIAAHCVATLINNNMEVIDVGRMQVTLGSKSPNDFSPEAMSYRQELEVL